MKLESNLNDEWIMSQIPATEKIISNIIFRYYAKAEGGASAYTHDIYLKSFNCDLASPILAYRNDNPKIYIKKVPY